MPICFGTAQCKECNDVFEIRSYQQTTCKCGKTFVDDPSPYSYGLDKNYRPINMIQKEYYEETEFLRLTDKAQDMLDEIRAINQRINKEYSKNLPFLVENDRYAIRPYKIHVPLSQEDAEKDIRNEIVKHINIEYNTSINNYSPERNNISCHINLHMRRKTLDWNNPERMQLEENIENRIAVMLDVIKQIDNGTINPKNRTELNELIENMPNASYEREALEYYDYNYRI